MIPSNPTSDVRNADLELVGRIRSGDGSAFEAMYRQHATRLYNLASRMMGAHGEADDLLQDIFLLAYRKLGSFRGESSLGTWLYRLAMNHCLDVLRNRQTRMGQQTDSLDEPDAPPVASPVPLVGAVSRIDLERAIESLPPACRAAFLLPRCGRVRSPGSRARCSASRKGRRSRRCTRRGCGFVGISLTARRRNHELRRSPE